MLVAARRRKGHMRTGWEGGEASFLTTAGWLLALLLSRGSASCKGRSVQHCRDKENRLTDQPKGVQLDHIGEGPSSLHRDVRADSLAPCSPSSVLSCTPLS